MSRIREDARSPLRPTAYPSALLSLVLAAVLVLAALAGQVLLAVTVLVGQLLLTASSGPRGRSLLPPRSARVAPVVVGSLVALAITLEPPVLRGAEGTSATSSSMVDSGVLSGVVFGGVAVVLAAFVAQLARRDGRGSLVASVTDTTATGILAVLLVGWVAAYDPARGPRVVAAAAVSVGVVTVVRALPGPAIVLLPGAVVGGAAAAAFVGGLGEVLSRPEGAAVGAVTALPAWLGCVAAGWWRPTVAERWAVEAVVPFVLAAPVVFALSQGLAFA